MKSILTFFVQPGALFLALFFVLVPFTHAAEAAAAAHNSSNTILAIAVILFVAKLGGLIEKVGQPTVLGELLVGIVLANIGIHFFETVRDDTVITFLAELGVIILLFQIGLESNIREIFRVGKSALLVALVGVILPFAGGYYIGKLILPGFDTNTYLFLGAALTATSVGITARVFKDLGKLTTPAAKIVLGAAVIDDILGLIILAVVSAIVTTGSLSPVIAVSILGKAIGFLVLSIYVGQVMAKQIGRVFSRVSTGAGMKFTIPIVFCLTFAYLAHLVGLAPIVGAFAAGLILDPVHFNVFKNPKLIEDIEASITHVGAGIKQKITSVVNHHKHKHIEDLIEPVSLLLIPIFFVVTGMQVDLGVLLDPSIVMLALIITFVAVVGKVMAGVVAGRGVVMVLVGFGMVPRGEVGLIFANIGKSLGVVSDKVFSVIIIMVVLTTLLTPPILSFLLKRSK